MKHNPSLKVLTLCIAAAVAACGGGGGNEASLPGSGSNSNDTDPPPASREFSGTAYLRTQVTARMAGETCGASQVNARALIEMCNAYREVHYGSASPPIDPAVLASLDVMIEEKYFDNGTRAASYSSGHVLDLPDLHRWLDEWHLSPAQVPATPLDCAVYKLVPINHATLWLDGLRYQLDDKKRTAKASRVPADFELRVGIDAEVVASWPSDVVADERCKVAAIETELARVSSCIWERFPVGKRFLNWPWVLRSDYAFGGTAGALSFRTVTLDVTTNGVLPEDRLRIPDGYTVTGA